MRDYELLLVVRPTLDTAAAVDVSKEVSELIKAREGQVNATNVWGRRKLAYTIDNHIEATYILQKVQIPPAQLPDFEFNLKLNESVLRYMIVRDHQPSVTELQESADEADASVANDAAEPNVTPAAEVTTITENTANSTTANEPDTAETVAPSSTEEASKEAPAPEATQAEEASAETASPEDEAKSEAS